MEKDGFKPKVQALSKGLDILECFTNAKDEIGIMEISERLDLPESTVYRMVTTLDDKGYLVQNLETKKYKLGLHLLKINEKSSELNDEVEVITKYMTELNEKFNETTNFAIRVNDKAVYLKKIDSKHILRPAFTGRDIYPCYCTSLGKSLVLDMTKKELNEIFASTFEQLTEKTILTKEDLLEDLRVAKERGYTVDNEEFNLGIKCFSVPVRAESLGGRIIGAISMPVPTIRLDGEREEKIKEALLDMAIRIKKDL
ncbi:MAG: IclR family transcriptional regulator [Clostridia bacterium]|nr:IclR family transcriptional regulator [Clostridia bacterium]